MNLPIVAIWREVDFLIHFDGCEIRVRAITLKRNDTIRPTMEKHRPIEEYRDYLRLLTSMQLGSRMRGKLDESDIVQQTVLEACRSEDQFKGQTEAERIAWLRAVLANVIAGTARHFSTQSRDAGREHSLEAELNLSASRLERALAADQTSPSGHAVSCGRGTRRLPKPCQRSPKSSVKFWNFIILKGMSLAEVATQVGKSRPAVAGLLFRGLRKLRELMGTG